MSGKALVPPACSPVQDWRQPVATGRIPCGPEAGASQERVGAGLDGEVNLEARKEANTGRD